MEKQQYLLYNRRYYNQTFYKNTNGHQIVQQLQNFDDNNAFIQEWNASMGGVEFETKDNDMETKRNSQMTKYQNHSSEVKSNTVELHEKNKGRDSESVFILTVHNCQQLKRADAFGKSDPYCIIFQDSYEVGRTPVIKNTLDPQWNCEIEIVFEEKNKHPEIILQVFDKDLIGEDNFHGLVYLPPHDVAKYIGEVNVAFTLNPDLHRMREAMLMLVDLCMFHFVRSMQMSINKMDSKINPLNPAKRKT